METSISNTNLPRYQCHKLVHATKIADIIYRDDGGATIIGSDLDVDQGYVDKHMPAIGGYFVRYGDGYQSFLPVEAFEDGYVRLGNTTSFDIGQAVKYMNDGLKVQRRGWNGKGLWLEMLNPADHSKMTLPYVYINYPDDSANTPGARCPWLASQTDLLAGDWQLVD